MAAEYGELLQRLHNLSKQNFVDVSAARVAMEQAANAIERLEHRVLVLSLEIKKGK